MLNLIFNVLQKLPQASCDTIGAHSSVSNGQQNINRSVVGKVETDATEVGVNAVDCRQNKRRSLASDDNFSAKSASKQNRVNNQRVAGCFRTASPDGCAEDEISTGRF